MSFSNNSHSIVQSLSRVRLFVTPWTAARQASLYITKSWSSPKLMHIESVMPSSHLILCRPLLLLPPIPPSIRVFTSESTLHMRWPKHWSCSFNIIPSKEHPGLISFRMDWLDLLAVQGTFKSLLQHRIIDHRKSKRFQKTSTFALLTMPKPLTVWITANCGKILKRLEYQTTSPAPSETCIQVKMQ